MDRVPTTKMDLARRALQSNLGKDAVDWATQQLVLGQDTPHLRQLAGFTGRETAWEMEETVDRTFRELGLGVPVPEEAVLLYARELAKQFIEGAVGREFLLRELCQLHVATDYSHELGPFFNLRWALDDIKEQGWSFYVSKATPENFDELLRVEVSTLLNEKEQPTLH